MINKIALSSALQTEIPSFNNSSEIIGSHFYLNPLIEKHVSFSLNFDFSLAGLDLGQSLKPHNHSYETSYIQLNDNSIYCEKQRLAIKPKDLVLIAPGVQHSFEMPENQNSFFGVSINQSASKSKNSYFADETFFSPNSANNDVPCVIKELNGLDFRIFNSLLNCMVRKQKAIKIIEDHCYLIFPLFDSNFDIKKYYFYFISGQAELDLNDSFDEAVVLAWKNQ